MTLPLPPVTLITTTARKAHKKTVQNPSHPVSVHNCMHKSGTPQKGFRSPVTAIVNSRPVGWWYSTFPLNSTQLSLCKHPQSICHRHEDPGQQERVAGSGDMNVRNRELYVAHTHHTLERKKPCTTNRAFASLKKSTISTTCPRGWERHYSTHMGAMRLNQGE